MHALVCEQFGPPATLRVLDRPEPELKSDRVLARVDAVGVGFVDGLLIQGRYQIKPPLPYVPGNEFCATVLEVGANVRDLVPGDRVMGLANGCFAERISIPAAACLRVPTALSTHTAAGFLLNMATALYGLSDCGRMLAGETVLILGASGGVGSAAIAVARAMGLHVIAGASSEKKVASALRSGAHSGVCYGTANWRDDLKRILAGRPLDAVVDPVGGTIAEAALRNLAPGGRFLVVGFAAGPVPSIPLNLPLLKRCSIVGVDWGGASRADPGLTPRLAATLIEWIEAGRLIPPPVSVRNLADVRQALDDQLAGHIAGKLVIDMTSPWPVPSVV